MKELKKREAIVKSIWTEGSIIVRVTWTIVIAVLGIAFWIWNDQAAQNIRIVQLNDTIHNIQETVNTMKSNDLAHIEVKLDTMSAQITNGMVEIAKLEALLTKK